MRNISWRSIREIKTPKERAFYQGYDKTRRQLVNHIFQGATADIARKMMIRSQAICRAFGARLVLQIHDELVFEVPDAFVPIFTGTMRRILQIPPTPDFNVPIVVEPKIGKRFGELQEISDLPSLYRQD